MAGKREGRKAKEERKAKKHERVGTRQNELTGGAKGRVGKCGLQSGRPRARAPSKNLNWDKETENFAETGREDIGGRGNAE